MNFRACKGCIHFYKYWANRDGLGNRTVSGYRCSARNGKLTKFPKQCKLRKEKSMTNADRIRAMTDEELANIVCCQNTKSGDECFDASCYECTLDWLKQEVSDNG